MSKSNSITLLYLVLAIIALIFGFIADTEHGKIMFNISFWSLLILANINNKKS